MNSQPLCRNAAASATRLAGSGSYSLSPLASHLRDSMSALEEILDLVF
jgi:hypothetical protein